MRTFLRHDSSFQLLIATILSAQCTDERVNKVSPALFKQFPTALELGLASLDEIKHLIRSINFFNNKAQNIQKTAQILTQKWSGAVPPVLNELIQLPGVGRKTANVVLGQAFNIPGITVDTHVKRLVKRLHFAVSEDPVKIEQELMRLWPTKIWNTFSTVLIVHGRKICKSRRPDCSACSLALFCPRIGVT